MADSFIEYPGNDVTTVFNFTVPFIAEAHVMVLVDEVLQLSSVYTVTDISDNGATFTMNVAPLLGETLKIQRVTPSSIIVNYQKGNTFGSDTLNIDSQQARYLIEELRDIGVQGATGATGATGPTGPAGAAPSGGGFMAYADLATASTPIDIVDNVYVTITNDGLGAETNDGTKPPNVTDLMDIPSGELNFSDLEVGDAIFVRNDLTVTPDSANSILSNRYTLGSGGGIFTLEGTVAILKNGGVPYRQSFVSVYIYMGSQNVVDNPGIFQIKLDGSDGEVVNHGSVITVIRYSP